MTLFFSSFFVLPSQLLNKVDFEVMCEEGKVLEQDERGVKVVQLTNGNIVKLFRLRSVISGGRIYSYARRFCRNAIRLNARDIPTVKVKQLYHFKENSNTAVLYEPLPGDTIKDIVKRGEVSTDFIKALAAFLSKMHKNGVHFHSLHTGNVVLTPEGKIGLIDISDLSIYPWPLFCNTRARSFKRLCKYQEDIKHFGWHHWKLFLEHYFEVSGLNGKCKRRIKQYVSKIIFF